MSPYPILYQDLKPEHIILCGDQVKLLDFGIASFFTGFGKNFQLYGTSRYCAPEILRGQPVTPGCRHLQSRQGFNGAFGRHVLPLFQTASVHLRAGMRRRSGRPLSGGLRSESRTASCTIIRESAVFASHSEHCRHREQTRCRRHAYFHFSCQHHESKAYSRNLYCRGRSASLLHAARANHRLIDQSGIFIYGSFRGIPDYGDSISVSVPPDDCVVRDYGTRAPALAELASFDLILFVLNGGDWDFVQAAAYGKQLALLPQTRFLCNHGCRSAAKAYARQLGHRVYCFPGRCGSIRYNTRKGTACFVHLTEERRETASSILIATKPKHTSPSAFSDVIRGLA